jgi:hypothetical protein
VETQREIFKRVYLAGVVIFDEVARFVLAGLRLNSSFASRLSLSDNYFAVSDAALPYKRRERLYIPSVIVPVVDEFSLPPPAPPIA